MYFERFFECLTECEIKYHEENIKLHSVHPSELISNKDKVIQEAILTTDKINEFKIKIIVTFTNLCNKFQEIAAKLKTKNADWFNKISHFDLNNKDLSKFEYEIYDYQKGLPNLTNTLIKKFDNTLISDLLGDSSAFKKKEFGEIFIEQDGEETVNKNYFRGSNEKIKINGSQAKTLFRYAVNWLKNYETAIVRPIMVENSEIRNIAIQALNVKPIITESTLLSESYFKDEYYDILLEDGTEPSDIKREEKEENKINSNPEENKKNKDNNEYQEAVQKWFKICSSVQTMKMNVAEEAYKDFTDFIDKVMNA